MVYGCRWSKQGRTRRQKGQRSCSPECRGGGKLGQRGRSGDGTVEMPTRAKAPRHTMSHCDGASRAVCGCEFCICLFKVWPPVYKVASVSNVELLSPFIPLHSRVCLAVSTLLHAQFTISFQTPPNASHTKSLPPYSAPETLLEH